MVPEKKPACGCPPRENNHMPYVANATCLPMNRPPGLRDPHRNPVSTPGFGGVCTVLFGSSPYEPVQRGCYLTRQ